MCERIETIYLHAIRKRTPLPSDTLKSQHTDLKVLPLACAVTDADNSFLLPERIIENGGNNEVRLDDNNNNNNNINNRHLLHIFSIKSLQRFTDIYNIYNTQYANNNRI